jgi:hypothetical protein
LVGCLNNTNLKLPSAVGDSFQDQIGARSILADQQHEQCHFLTAKLECPTAMISIFRSCQLMKKSQDMTTCLKRGNQSANAVVILFDPGNSAIFGEKELQECT